MAQRLQLDRSNHTLVPHPTHRSHRRRSSRWRWRATTAAALTLTFAGAITAVLMLRHTTSESASVPANEAFEESQLSLDVLAPEDFDNPLPLSSVGRPVYRHSVVPGGTYSPDELRGAIARDVVVAAHYEKLDQTRLRTEIVPNDRYVHVSYRKGDQVFWTAKKVLLRKGETILTDGTTQIRTRCGNCIAEEPAGPTSADEPDVVEFDRLVDAPPTPKPEVALVAPQAPATGSASPADPITSFGPALLNSVPLGTEALRSETGGAGAPDPLAAAERAGGPGNNYPPLLPDLPPSGSDNPLPPFNPFPPGLDNPFPQGTDDLPPDTPIVPPIDNPPGNPQTPVAVPEPGTLLLLGGGAAMLIRRYRRRSKQ